MSTHVITHQFYVELFVYVNRHNMQQLVISLCLLCNRYYPVGRSFYYPERRRRLGEGLESWGGFVQSMRPVQMGLSLNIGLCLLSSICNSFFFFYCTDDMIICVYFYVLFAQCPCVLIMTANFHDADLSSTVLVEPLYVIEFASQLLNRDVSCRTLSDADCAKVYFLFFLLTRYIMLS